MPVGRCSPEISLSGVALPAPFGATRPVPPPPTVKDRSREAGEPSGQEKERFEQRTNVSDMREPSDVMRACRGRPAGTGTRGATDHTQITLATGIAGHGEFGLPFADTDRHPA